MDTNTPDQDVFNTASQEMRQSSGNGMSYVALFFIAVALAFVGLAWFSIAPLFTGALGVIFGILGLLTGLLDLKFALVLLGLAVASLSGWVGWSSYSSANTVAAAPHLVAQTAPETVVSNGSTASAELADAIAAKNANNAAIKAKNEANRKRFEAQGALVTNHRVPLFLETQASGGISPADRAQIVAQRLNDISKLTGLRPEKIQVRVIHSLPTVFYLKTYQTGYILATIDPQTAAQFGFAGKPTTLAFWWRDVLRDHSCIIAGNPPIYTTPYSSILQRVYALCQTQGREIPTNESFETAISKLTSQEHDALQGLYIQVPANYHPQAEA